jgi:hypothetical protein
VATINRGNMGAKQKKNNFLFCLNQEEKKIGTLAKIMIGKNSR